MGEFLKRWLELPVGDRVPRFPAALDIDDFRTRWRNESKKQGTRKNRTIHDGHECNSWSPVESRLTSTPSWLEMIRVEIDGQLYDSELDGYIQVGSCIHMFWYFSVAKFVVSGKIECCNLWCYVILLHVEHGLINRRCQRNYICISFHVTLYICLVKNVSQWKKITAHCINNVFCTRYPRRGFDIRYKQTFYNIFLFRSKNIKIIRKIL